MAERPPGRRLERPVRRSGRAATPTRPTGEARPSTISRETFLGRLLPAVPAEHRAIVCAAAGAGLRWGECAGLAWSAVDLDQGVLRVVQVAIETHSGIMLRTYPKSRAGLRTVPLPGFLADALRQRRGATDPDGRALIFADRDGGPQRRSNFRRRVWLPSLVRAGLLGRVAEIGPGRWVAQWPDRAGAEHQAEFPSEAAAVAQVAAAAYGGLRFHDLRHSYATWLVTDGVPINIVQRVMGHEQASTTLDRYTHTPDGYADRVRQTFADDLLTFRPLTPSQERGSGAEGGADQEREPERKKGRPPSGGDGGRRGVRLRGGLSRTRSAVTGGATAEGPCCCTHAKSRRKYKHAVADLLTSSGATSTPCEIMPTGCGRDHSDRGASKHVRR
nr:site-specific integrase [Micromonospora inyonensis]